MLCHQGFPDSSAGKESACSVGDLASIPGLGRFPGGGIKTIPKKKKCKKAKLLSEEALQIADKSKEAKGKGEKERLLIWLQSSKKYQGR